MEKETSFIQPFVIRLIESIGKDSTEDPIVHYSNGDENSQNINDFILNVNSFRNELELDLQLNSFIIQSSIYQNIHFIAFHFSFAEVKAPNFFHKMYLLFSSKKPLSGLENMPIFGELIDFIKQQMIKQFEKFKKDFIYEYQKYSLIKKHNPEEYKQVSDKNTYFLSLIEKYKIPFSADISPELENNYMDCIIIKDDQSKSNRTDLTNIFESSFDMNGFVEKCNALMNSFYNWKYDRYYLKYENEMMKFRIGEMPFIDFTKYVELNSKYLNNLNISLLSFSKTRILHHLIYAMNTGRTIIFKTSKYADEVLLFSKKLGMICPFWNEADHLKVFDHKITIAEAREYAITICPEFEGQHHNNNTISYIDWDKSYFEGVLCPQDCCISKISDSNGLTSESNYILLLSKRINDYADLFIALCAKYVFNVPTSFHKAKEVFEQLGFSQYDEDILSFWSHVAVSKTKRPIILSFKNRAGHGIASFKPFFHK